MYCVPADEVPIVADIEARLQALDRAHALIRELDGAITFWSHGMERLYGFSAAEALGRPAHLLLKTEFPGRLDRIEAELMERGEWTGEVVHRRRNGEIVVVASHWSLWRGTGRHGRHRGPQ